MSAADLERIAREAKRLSATMESAAKQLDHLGKEVGKVIGGTASREDFHLMLEASTAAGQAHAAARSFAQAADEATKAALRERERSAAGPPVKARR